MKNFKAFFVNMLLGVLGLFICSSGLGLVGLNLVTSAASSIFGVFGLASVLFFNFII